MLNKIKSLFDKKKGGVESSEVSINTTQSETKETTPLINKEQEQEQVKNKKTKLVWSCPACPVMTCTIFGIVGVGVMILVRFGSKWFISGQQFSGNADMMLGSYVHANDSYVPLDGTSITNYRCFYNYKTVSGKGTGIDVCSHMVHEFTSNIKEFAFRKFAYNPMRYINYGLSAVGFIVPAAMGCCGAVDIATIRSSGKSKANGLRNLEENLGLWRIIYKIKYENFQFNSQRKDTYPYKVVPHNWIKWPIYIGVGAIPFFFNRLASALLQELYYGKKIFRNPKFKNETKALSSMVTGFFGKNIFGQNHANAKNIIYNNFGHSIEDGKDPSAPHRALQNILGFFDVPAGPGSLAYDTMRIFNTIIEGMFQNFMLLGLNPDVSEILIDSASLLLPIGIMFALHFILHTGAKTLEKKLKDSQNNEVEIVEEEKNIPLAISYKNVNYDGEKYVNTQKLKKQAQSPLGEIHQGCEDVLKSSKQSSKQSSKHCDKFKTLLYTKKNIIEDVFQGNEYSEKPSVFSCFNNLKLIHKAFEEAQNHSGNYNKIQNELVKDNSLSCARIIVVSCKILMSYILEKSIDYVGKNNQNSQKTYENLKEVFKFQQNKNEYFLNVVEKYAPKNDKTKKIKDKTEKIKDKTEKIKDKTEKIKDKTEKMSLQEVMKVQKIFEESKIIELVNQSSGDVNKNLPKNVKMLEFVQKDGKVPEGKEIALYKTVKNLVDFVTKGDKAICPGMIKDMENLDSKWEKLFNEINSRNENEIKEEKEGNGEGRSTNTIVNVKIMKNN